MKKQLSCRWLGFTLIEMLIVMIILCILFALFLPQLIKSRENAQVVICMNNLQQIALGYHNYMHDFDGAMPQTEYWLDDFADIYMQVAKKDEIFTCPKTKKSPSSVWDDDGRLRNGDYLTSGTIEDVKKSHSYNSAQGNDPYHFDPNDSSTENQAVMTAKKRQDRIIYEKYWGLHFDGEFFNVVYIRDRHYEKEKNGVAAYWMLDDCGWIDTSLDPFPAETKVFPGTVSAGSTP